MKVIFFHNTMAEYRIGFFEALDDRLDLTMVFTDFNQGKIIYNNELSRADVLDKSTILEGAKIKRIMQASSCIKKNEYDWIILPTLDDLYSIVLSVLILKNKKIGKVGYFWEKWESPIEKQPLKRRIQEALLKVLVMPVLRKVDVAFYPGLKTKEYLDKFNLRKAQLIRVHDVSLMNENERINIRHEYGIDADKKIVLFLGRIVRIKGLDILIRAFNNCGDDFLRTHVLLVAGNGEELSYCKEIAKKSKLDNIIFAGQVSSEDRYSFFKASDVFVLPDRCLDGRVDAWGLTVNEALQCGCYVIVSDAAGSAYDLINKNNGIVFEENNITQLTEALLGSNSETVLDAARRQRSRFVEEYNYEVMAEDFLKAMEKYK